MAKVSSIGIYVRESRDDNGEKRETIETQRGLLIAYAEKEKLGEIHNVYMDDNVSGSGFERVGLNILKKDVESRRIDILLLKDLSRLGRNNAKTLLLLDYIEEKGVRVITSDGRYDSLRDNETVGIETWANERYVKDISRKIRASLKYKIEKGEYIGNAPFGYKKSIMKKNKLSIDESVADVVRNIFKMYINGYGYSSIAGSLNDRGIGSPGGNEWSGVAVRRIICSRVYIGDTIQGVSEKISYKNRKTRRLPKSEWVLTEGTHEPIIDKVSFNTAQRIRELRKRSYSEKNNKHILSGLIKCGNCGSNLYVRRDKNQTFFICGKYYKFGRKFCSSHFILESTVVDILYEELLRIVNCGEVEEKCIKLMEKQREGGNAAKDSINKLQQRLVLKQKQHEILYIDRLEGKISIEMYEKMSEIINDKISEIMDEIRMCSKDNYPVPCYKEMFEKLKAGIGNKMITSKIVRILVNKITVYDYEDDYMENYYKNQEMSYGMGKKGMLIIDLKTNKVYDN